MILFKTYVKFKSFEQCLTERKPDACSLRECNLS